MSVIRIGSFNVAAQAMSWQRKTFDGRRDDILAGVTYYGLDILCVQENGNPTRTARLTNTLSKAKLRRAPGGGKWRYIYFNNELLQLRDSGLMKLNRLGTKTGQTWFVTSSHLTASFLGSSATRRSEARRLLSETRRLNPSGHREIHAGDFNSVRDVSAAVMIPAGFRDTAAVAGTRTGAGYNTFNGRTTVIPHRRTQKIAGEHLDHIYVEADMVHRVTHWSQRSDVEASDHNLIMIKVTV